MKKEYKIENKKFEFEITEIVKGKRTHSKSAKAQEIQKLKKNENPKTGRLAQSMKLKNYAP